MFSKEFLEFFKNEYKENSERSIDERNVITKYGKLFSLDNIDNLLKTDFLSFLNISNNKHWDGIHRNNKQIIEDFDKLKSALKILLDETRPIAERLSILVPRNKPSYVKFLNKAILTPILLVVYPKKYGVYNNRTLRVMEKLDIFKVNPKTSSSFGEEYYIINNQLLKLSEELCVSLWQLDYLWWYYEKYGYSFILPEIYDLEEPSEVVRKEVKILRVIRDSIISYNLKETYDFRCQICDKQIPLNLNNQIRYYIEAHHLKPLAIKHNGPDRKDNLLILCPNHHVEFDYGVMAINPVANRIIIHIDEQNKFNNQEFELKHEINPKYIKYHFKLFKNNL